MIAGEYYDYNANYYFFRDSLFVIGNYIWKHVSTSNSTDMYVDIYSNSINGLYVYSHNVPGNTIHVFTLEV